MRDRNVNTLKWFVGPNVRVLRVDWFAASARFFARQNPNANYTLPEKLEKLAIRVPAVKAWYDGSSAWSLLDPLVTFLLATPSLQHFAVVGHLPNIALPAKSLPNLISYSGSMDAVLTVAGGGRLEHLEITDSDKGVAPMTVLLGSLSILAPGLRSLRVGVSEWDIEILYAITQLFPALQNLTILYHDGYPLEVSPPLHVSSFFYSLSMFY